MEKKAKELNSEQGSKKKVRSEFKLKRKQEVINRNRHENFEELNRSTRTNNKQKGRGKNWGKELLIED
jgi:hypothetical protein